MINLYLKALGAQSLEEIVNIARQEHDYLIHNDTSACSPFYKFDLKYYTTLMESMSILNQTFQRKESISSFEIIFSYIVNPFISFFNPSCSSLKFRCFCTGIIQNAPWATCIDNALSSRFNILSPKFSKIAILSCGTLYQTIGKLTEYERKSILSTFTHFLVTYFEYFLINYGSYRLSKYIGEKIKFLPISIINFLISIIFTAPMIRHFTSKGLRSLCYSIFFSLAEHKSNKVDFDLPDDCVVPNELKCLICYDLVNDPVQCQGQIMCKSCLQRWINSSHSYQNPVTGRDFLPDEVSKEYVFGILSQQFIKYATRKSSK